MPPSLFARWWDHLDRPGWRAFLAAISALALALLLALYSGAAAETGRTGLAGASALAALGLAGWVAVTLVPVLARRTPLRWLAYRIDYKLTRDGWIYIGGILAISLAALNTGNNLLFLILSCLIAVILVSGILSSTVLSGVSVAFHLPEHIFAGQPAPASMELRNEKQTLPSFSLRVTGRESRRKDAVQQSGVLPRPVYFPYLPQRGAVRQKVELLFARRGVYRQDALRIVTRFPFGFLQKSREVESALEVAVYPTVQPTEEFYEVLPLLSGELESFMKGRGHDLYSIRDHQASDGARFVDWKASARSGALKVREFAREDERRVVLVLDPELVLEDASPGGLKRGEAEEQFERGVSLCACLAWHFHEIDAMLQFRTAEMETPMAPAGEIIYDVLRDLAFSRPLPSRSGRTFLSRLAEETDLFKIILTSQPHGSIPTSLWSSSYFVFMQSL